jgi:hypothetical protein
VARLLLDEIYPLSELLVAELVAWELPRQLPGSAHRFKYRFALIAAGVCVLRYDNEAGKGDHRHVGRRQFAYRFTDMDELAVDFWKDVEAWQRQQSGS